MRRNVLIFIVLMITGIVTFHCHDNPVKPKKENHPGKILWVEVPDSIQIPPANKFNRALIKAAVQDSDGLSDVDSVYFYSRKPDGTMANGGAPFPMVDNGKPFNINNPWQEAGDEKANDGIYSLTIIITNDAPVGRFYFTFYMRDKAGHLSPGVIDSIEVYK